ncbi:asparagine synthetase B family protein [Aromatoleum sp.]|uniref:asparagine synthetase B family protein n=1 Tax=Aromatoleum sp. TaxID=2307007 RepID=UPI002FC6A938
MRASFLGQLSISARPTDAVPLGGAIAFDGGYVRVGDRVGDRADVARHDGLVCIASGAANFPSGRSAEHGQGALWIDAYRAHGVLAAARARGRFSVVIIDTVARRVWAATDRFATYPVCLAPDEAGCRFADRADALAHERAELSPQGMFDYLFFHVVPAPLTIFEGVVRLEQGHYALWENGRLERDAWWKPEFAEPGSGNFDAAKREFLDLVRRGVEREAQGDRVGAFLSGGTDSSTVSGMLCEVLGRPARTYSIGFDAAGYDEMEYARIAAKCFGTDHHEYYVTPDDLLDGIPKVATHFDQPFGNSSAVPAWICATRAREDGVTKMLAGDGGDELFGGNVRYAKQRMFGLYDSVPPLLRSAALEPLLGLAPLQHVAIVRKGASYVEQARVPMPDRMQMYNMLIRLGTENVFAPDFLARVDQEEPFRAQREVWRAARGDALINHMLAYDWKYTLADNDLPKVIGTTQLAGVDAGFPLVTDELLEFSMTLPPEWKLKRFQLRWFFKEALRGFLPDEIIAKKKHGFGLPFGVWVCKHDGLKALAFDALESFKHRGVVRPGFIDTLLKEHLPAYPGYYGEMVWILMVMEFWLRSRVPEWHIR